MKHPIFHGLIASLMLAALMGIVLGITVYFTSLPEMSLVWELLLLGLVILIGSMVAAYRTGKKGLLIGLQVSAAFILLFIIINLVFYPDLLTWKPALIKVSIMLASGLLGGALGVALKG